MFDSRRRSITNQGRREHHVHIVLNDREMKLLNELRTVMGSNNATLFRMLMLEKCQQKNIGSGPTSSINY
jgi:hypothetical protein